MYIIPADDEQLNNLVHNMKTLRRQHDLSLREMAGIMHTSVYVVRMLEKGQMSTWLYVDALFRAGRYFRIPVSQLLKTRM